MQKKSENVITIEPVKKTNNNLIFAIIIIILLLLVVFVLVYLGYNYLAQPIEPNETEQNESYINDTIPVNDSGINDTSRPRTAVCGNGKCEAKENYTSCPADCRRPGSGGGGNNGGNNTPPSCTPNCTNKQCGSDRCSGTCPPGCNAGYECNSTGNCAQLINCTIDSNCSYLTDSCGKGLCNQTSKQCYASYNSSSTVCRNNVSECDAVEMCTGSSIACQDDLNKSNGASCNGGTCQNGKCTVCTPQCSGKQCGNDGCGGTCAPGCSNGEYCDNGMCGPLPVNSTIHKHIVAYGSYSDSELEFIADKFELVDGISSQADKLKAKNPNIKTLKYEDLMGMHESYSDWNEVNQHEDWFVHDQYGHRLRQTSYSWYLMDPSSGWKDHLVLRIQNNLNTYPDVDGIFTDDTWGYLSPTRFYANINNEQSVVEDDGSVQVDFVIWNDGGAVSGQGGVQGVWDNSGHTGTNYYAGGSFSGKKITLGAALPKGATVYVKYSAKDNQLAPSQDIIINWHNDTKAQLQAIKNILQSKLLIINTGFEELDYLEVSDGKMIEGLLSTSSTSDYEFPDEGSLSKAIELNKKVTGKNKILLAYDKTSGNSQDELLIKKKMMLCYAISLLSYDAQYSYPGFKVQSLSDLGKITYYPEWDMPIGVPKGDYFIFEEKRSAAPNLIQNPSFETNFDNWKITSQNSGTPDISSISFDGNKSAHFISSPNAAYISGNYVPVEPNKNYALSARFKANNLIPNETSNWKSLGVWGWFYDENYNRLSVQLSLLKPGSGDFDWMFLTNTLQAPSNAKYFLISSAGMHKEAAGEGWIDDIRFSEDVPDEYIIYARNFSNGLVLVNIGRSPHTVELKDIYQTYEGTNITSITLEGKQGIILLKENSEIQQSSLSLASQVYSWLKSLFS